MQRAAKQNQPLFPVIVMGKIFQDISGLEALEMVLEDNLILIRLILDDYEMCSHIGGLSSV